MTGAASQERRDQGGKFRRGGFRSRASNATEGQYYHWLDPESRRNYGQHSMPHSDQGHGILSIITANCLPSSHASNNNESHTRRTFMPVLLLSLVLYGSISMIFDISNSISSLHKSTVTKQFQTSDRFHGGFVSVYSRSAQSYNVDKKANIGSSSNMSMLRSALSVDLTSQATNIDKNNPTTADVPLLTEQILSTTFQHVLEYSKHDSPYENEVPFFWTTGTTSDPLFQNMLKCFPNVVQASGGKIIGIAGEEALRKFPTELKLLQKNSQNSATVADGGKYVNVDLFTPEGVERAANLHLLFPSAQYPLIHERDYGDAISFVSDRTMTETSNAESSNVTAYSRILASNQVQLLVSPFLTEVASGLFASPTGMKNGEMPPPKARIHSIMLPTSNRIRAYHQMHSSNGGSGTFLEFITSPSIFVNNYMTRVLSGQWVEGTPVTEVHLEVAKNVISRKIHLWPNRGVQDMITFWAQVYGWQEGQVRFRESIMQNFQQQPENQMPTGLACMFPPPDPNLPPPVRVPPPAPTDLEVEINRILTERNALDEQLFAYVVQLYDSWMARS
ncbi:hypothetical protein HJC23_004790 [Cyclotella cryptica]|uniref:Uncharacterized protein n=1 Tax=Cyclotella cryptica TaxID=29204 RepID=A0ABD3PXN3_9STRA|eukprot:CCRYP_010408-RA/>CCRYP_010408-RA protein AED:0.09 eAED:0.09 QI:0/-1/0/1/-1/1/1/0/561